MKYLIALIITALLSASCNSTDKPTDKTATTTDTGEPWRNDQLMPPADLATMITNNDPQLPLIICIGPSGGIKGSVDMGPAQEKEGIATIKKYLEGLPKDQHLVIYCGCCPFSPCPNVRPAFSLLTEMGFTNHKLLNLSTNLKTDWINPGYPMKEN
ncbi:hypothetical protein BH09BAC1_BH09BAC1_02890 [soil metagenome]